jgi:hypothetical protein
LRSVEQAIGLMKNLQTSIVVEETWVEKQTEKLQSLPTATSARELDVSDKNKHFISVFHTFFTLPKLVKKLMNFVIHC